jgi:hypothetical protein
MNSKFKVGDRVEAVRPCDRRDDVEGKVGTVKDIIECKTPILVEFDEDVKGHDGLPHHEGHTYEGKKGHCWWCERENLELVEQVREENKAHSEAVCDYGAFLKIFGGK